MPIVGDLQWIKSPGFNDYTLFLSLMVGCSDWTVHMEEAGSCHTTGASRMGFGPKQYHGIIALTCGES